MNHISKYRMAAALVFMLAAATAASTAAAERGGERFRIEGTITPRALSEDGRYGVQAQLTATQGKRPGDGRFALKAVNVPAGGCATALDAIFANGFEL